MPIPGKGLKVIYRQMDFVINRIRFIGNLVCALKNVSISMVTRKNIPSTFLFQFLNFPTRIGEINRALKQNPGKISQFFPIVCIVAF